MPIRFTGVAFDITERKNAEVVLSEQAKLSALRAEIGAALTQVAGLKASLQKCAEAIVEHLDAAFARIWVLSAREEVLELQASAGIYTHIDGAHSRVPVGSLKIGRIALTRQPHLTNNVPDDPDVSDPDWARRENMIAFAGYPLIVEDRLIGVFGLFRRHALESDTLNALASVSATIAIAIERKRSGEALVRYAEDLKRSNEDLEQFAHVASHDLRSPLNSVLNFTELILRRQGETVDEEMKFLLETVRDSAKRMGELISALLVYSRLNDAEANDPTPVSSLAAYEAAAANLHAAIAEAHAEIERGCLPEVLSNATQLCQVFQNLISNAIHYRGDARPHVRVFAERKGRFWQFSVSDNGPGIPPKYHSLIFQPFKRLHGDERPGSGIGLAFCRKFIERAGGAIWVESKEGKGATFRFTLPAGESGTRSGARGKRPGGSSVRYDDLLPEEGVCCLDLDGEAGGDESEPGGEGCEDACRGKKAASLGFVRHCRRITRRQKVRPCASAGRNRVEEAPLSSPQTPFGEDKRVFQVLDDLLASHSWPASGMFTPGPAWFTVINSSVRIRQWFEHDAVDDAEMALVAPIPMDIVINAISVNKGLRRNIRRLCRRSCAEVSMKLAARASRHSSLIREREPTVRFAARFASSWDMPARTLLPISRSMCRVIPHRVRHPIAVA